MNRIKDIPRHKVLSLKGRTVNPLTVKREASKLLLGKVTLKELKFKYEAHVLKKILEEAGKHTVSDLLTSSFGEKTENRKYTPELGKVIEGEIAHEGGKNAMVVRDNLGDQKIWLWNNTVEFPKEVIEVFRYLSKVESVHAGRATAILSRLSKTLEKRKIQFKFSIDKPKGNYLLITSYLELPKGIPLPDELAFKSYVEKHMSSLNKLVS